MLATSFGRPWHVFVDTSPGTDADFVVAATFDEEPGLDEVNNAIVECLEGSEQEDALVAQQMQQALENKQRSMMQEQGMEQLEGNDQTNESEENDNDESDNDDDDIDDEDFDLYDDLWNEESI